MYFAVVSPGLEKLAHEEALEKFPNATVSIVHGGLMIEGVSALALNQWLKIPTRILLRLFEARVRDLPKLYKKIKSFDWRPFYVDVPTTIKATSSSSRLFDDRKIAKAASDGIADSFKAIQPKKADIEKVKGKEPAALYLRFDNDNLVVSIDTTGERLDRRGVRTWVGEAPLRETYAQACLRALAKQVKTTAKLCDPMSGSGVFAREALDWTLPNDQREFSLMSYPSFKHEDVNVEISSPFESIIAIESDEKTFKALEHNASGATLIHGNSLEKLDIDSGLVFIANPPYGIRLKLDNPTAFLNNVVEKLSAYQAKAIALLVPKDIRFKKEHKVILEFSNGGIPVKLVYFV